MFHSIHSPITPILLSLLQSDPSSFLGPSTFFLPQPLKVFSSFHHIILFSTTPCSLSFLWSSIQYRGVLHCTNFHALLISNHQYQQKCYPQLYHVFFPLSTWTWIASINIIDVFHLGLPCPASYSICSSSWCLVNFVNPFISINI